MQDHLRVHLEEEYFRLGLNAANTVDGLRATLETEHNKVVAVIKKAKSDFDAALAFAIRTTRDEYKEHDEQIQLTLQKIDYL